MTQVKVDFILDIEDDFPPINVETLNGLLLDDGTIEIDNTPFFVEGIAVGDKVRCLKDTDSKNYRFKDVASGSSNKAISIIFIEDDCKEEVYQFFKGLGCYCEYGEFKDFNMLAVDIKENINYEGVVRFLSEKESLELLSYAELCI